MELFTKGPNRTIACPDGVRASFKFTLRNAKLFFRRDFAQMQANAPVFAENDIIWQPCHELICLAAHLLHKFAKCRPIVIHLREFNARFLAKRFMSRDFSKLCLASSEQFDDFISAVACHWFIKPRYPPVCNRSNPNRSRHRSTKVFGDHLESSLLVSSFGFSSLVFIQGFGVNRAIVSETGSACPARRAGFAWQCRMASPELSNPGRAQ